MKILSISELNQISGSKAGKYFKNGWPTAEAAKKFVTKCAEVYLGDFLSRKLGLGNHSKAIVVVAAMGAEDFIDSMQDE